MGISSYSTTPASNTSISGINIAEGCAPSGINDAIRQMMADIATDVKPQQAPTATGTANAIVVALSPAITSYVTGQRFSFIPSGTNTGAVTINYGGGVINLQKRGGLALAPNEILTGVVCEVIYDGTRAVLLNPQPYSHGADIASAATLNLDNATGNYVYVTGTTGITAITLAEGREVTVKFTGVLTITNGASLICPGGVNFTTAVNDTLVFRGEAAGVVRAIGGLKANGWPMVLEVASQASQSGKYLTTNGTTTSWSTVSANSVLPTQTGNAGKYLTTDGTNSSWSALTAVQRVYSSVQTLNSAVSLVAFSSIPTDATEIVFSCHQMSLTTASQIFFALSTNGTTGGVNTVQGSTWASNLAAAQSSAGIPINVSAINAAANGSGRFKLVSAGQYAVDAVFARQSSAVTYMSGGLQFITTPTYLIFWAGSGNFNSVDGGQILVEAFK